MAPGENRDNERSTDSYCIRCGHDNEDLSVDEEGDLVCRECGHVIPPKEITLAVADDSISVTCAHCGHENHQLEPDEDGDLVCEECGHVIEPPSGNNIVTCQHC